jgi:hypothetical protein
VQRRKRTYMAGAFDMPEQHQQDGKGAQAIE